MNKFNLVVNGKTYTFAFQEIGNLHLSMDALAEAMGWLCKGGKPMRSSLASYLLPRGIQIDQSVRTFLSEDELKMLHKHPLHSKAAVGDNDVRKANWDKKEAFFQSLPGLFDEARKYLAYIQAETKAPPATFSKEQKDTDFFKELNSLSDKVDILTRRLSLLIDKLGGIEDAVQAAPAEPAEPAEPAKQVLFEKVAEVVPDAAINLDAVARLLNSSVRVTGDDVRVWLLSQGLVHGRRGKHVLNTTSARYFVVGEDNSIKVFHPRGFKWLRRRWYADATHAPEKKDEKKPESTSLFEPAGPAIYTQTVKPVVQRLEIQH